MNDKTKKALNKIESNYNTSLFAEIFKRREKDYDKVALFYRGRKIKYGQLKEEVMEYAHLLKNYGINKGDEIPICMSNCPEFVYLLGAISIIGAKANIFGADFDKDYIIKIIKGCNSKIIFATDDLYEKISDSVDKTDVKDKVVISLTDSLKNGINPYAELDDEWKELKNNISDIKKNDENILSIDEFFKLYSGIKDNPYYIDSKIENNSTLDDIFTITYSSGSTNSSCPKAIMHNVRSYIVMGIFHDSDLSGVPSMANLRVMAHIPTHSNTNIMSCITDCLMQGSEIALEPIYNEDHFVNSLLINKPSFITATRSFWIKAAKTIFNNPNYKNVKMPFLLVPMSVGEPLSPGEEKYCNKFIRKVQMGKEKTHLPLSPITMSIAGGDCEHGGLFFLLFRSLQSKKLQHLLNNRECGLRTYDMADVQVLNGKGEICNVNEIGRITANSPCTMVGYKDNEEATEKFFIKDSNGVKRADCNVYGYIDECSGIHIKGRINENDIIPPFEIADEVLKDTKNVMSCEVVNVDDNYVIHFETIPNIKINLYKIICSIHERCSKKFGEDIVSKFVYRYRNNFESFPLTGCGKRNNKSLINEGIIDDCIKVLGNKDNRQLMLWKEFKTNSKNTHYQKVIKK